jgi:hypothetical protein
VARRDTLAQRATLFGAVLFGRPYVDYGYLTSAACRG